MAQRTVHYLFGDLIFRELSLRNRNRFLLGNVLPDAYAAPHMRDLTHYKNRSLPNDYVFFDFDRFGEEFAGNILSDDLYLGYYTHLLTDSFYRLYLLECIPRDQLPRTPEDVARMHGDYRLLNGYMVKKYGIRHTVTLPEDFDSEPICRIAEFCPAEFLEDMKKDFEDTSDGQTLFLTESILDGFVDRYVPAAAEELRHILNGAGHLRAADLAWPKKG